MTTVHSFTNLFLLSTLSLSLWISKGTPPSFLAVLFIILVFTFLLEGHSTISSSFALEILIVDAALPDATISFVTLIFLQRCLTASLLWFNSYLTSVSQRWRSQNLVSIFHFTILVFYLLVFSFLCFLITQITQFETLSLSHTCFYLV